jgi:hypothetical protein
MSVKVKRFDISKLDGAVRTPQGFLKAPAVLTRVGVFKYKQKDGTIRREARLPEEVFKPESLATLSMAPLTNEHPEDAVTPLNVKELSIGTVGENITHDDRLVKSSVIVMDSPSIEEVESGDKVELSCGYDCEMDNTPGVFNGEEYDCVQRNIVYNHVCITKLGRAGPEVRLRLDSQDAIQQPKETRMEKITINGVEYEVTPELKAALEAELAKLASAQQTADNAMKEQEAAKAKADEAQAQVASANQEKSELQAKADELMAKCDSLEEKLKQRKDSTLDEATLRARIQTRVKLEKVAAVVLKKDSAEIEKMSDMDIKKAVIGAKSSVDLKDKSEAYVEARYDSIVEDINEEIKGQEELSKAFESRFDSRKTDSQSARERQKERTLNGWKENNTNK